MFFYFVFLQESQDDLRFTCIYVRSTPSLPDVKTEPVIGYIDSPVNDIKLCPSLRLLEDNYDNKIHPRTR